MTALWLATRGGALFAVEALLARGVDVQHAALGRGPMWHHNSELCPSIHRALIRAGAGASLDVFKTLFSPRFDAPVSRVTESLRVFLTEQSDAAVAFAPGYAGGPKVAFWADDRAPVVAMRMIRNAAATIGGDRAVSLLVEHGWTPRAIGPAWDASWHHGHVPAISDADNLRRAFLWRKLREHCRRRAVCFFWMGLAVARAYAPARWCRRGGSSCCRRAAAWRATWPTPSRRAASWSASARSGADGRRVAPGGDVHGGAGRARGRVRRVGRRPSPGSAARSRRFSPGVATASCSRRRDGSRRGRSRRRRGQRLESRSAGRRRPAAARALPRLRPRARAP